MFLLQLTSLILSPFLTCLLRTKIVLFWDLHYRICRILSCAEFVIKSNLKRASVFGIGLVAACRVGHYKGSAVSLKLDKTKVFAKQS